VPSFATTRYLWEDADARLRTAAASDRRDLERGVDLVVSELRRRLGGTFTVDELIALYDEGTDWVPPIARRAAPANPRAWEEEVVGGAAFWRYAREAQDFGGGRRRGD
jgi:hypothetical protein